jgi:hypothetical protein
MASKVSVHGLLAALFLDCGEAEHHGREHVVEEGVLFVVAMKLKSKRERGQGQDMPLKGIPWYLFPSTRSYLPIAH